MALGALVEAGLPFDELKRALGSLALGDAHVHAKRVLRAGVSATKFTVHEHAHDHPHEHLGGSTQHVGGSTEHVGGSTQDVGESAQHVGGSHQHSHPHRSLPEIFRLIDRSSL